MFDLDDKRIFVAGHRGLVGSAIVRRLGEESCTVLTATRAELDLRDQAAVKTWFLDTRPDAVVLAAAKVGGILANDTYPADFIHENLVIEANVIGAAHQADVDRLLFLGSSCIYPKFADQPIREESLLTGSLEPTNEWYAIAKIAGIKMCEAFRRQHGRDYVSAMPSNLYGPGDNFDLKSSHVLPALIRKAHEAKIRGDRQLIVWGTGSPRREFLYVDDCADACVHLLRHYSDPMHINVGSGDDISILELTRLVCDVVGLDAKLVQDTSKPDGTPRKLMAADRLRATGWAPRTDLRSGVVDTYRWFLEHVVSPAAS